MGLRTSGKTNIFSSVFATGVHAKITENNCLPTFDFRSLAADQRGELSTRVLHDHACFLYRRPFSCPRRNCACWKTYTETYERMTWVYSGWAVHNRKTSWQYCRGENDRKEERIRIGPQTFDDVLCGSCPAGTALVARKAHGHEPIKPGRTRARTQTRPDVGRLSTADL